MQLRSLLVVLATAMVGSLAPSAAAAPTADPVPAGSYLAVVDHGPASEYGGIDARTQRLVLVSPSGETTTVYKRRVSRKYGGFSLLDWSEDGRTALLTAVERDATHLIRVDVATGVVAELPVKLLNSAVLDPDGTGVLATTWKNRRSDTLVLDRISWAGARTRLREGVNGSMIPGRNGTVITVREKGHAQYVLSTADGSVVTTIRGNDYCYPVRWWDASRLLESCGDQGDLFLLDPATGATSRLTAKHGSGDYGHLDARVAGGRLFVQVAGACGHTFVARKTDSGAIKHLRVPGAVGNVLMLDAVDDDLVLEHAGGCDSDHTRAMLTRFDPVHHAETPLLVLGRHEAFGRILVLGEVRASAY